MASASSVALLLEERLQGVMCQRIGLTILIRMYMSTSDMFHAWRVQGASQHCCVTCRSAGAKGCSVCRHAITAVQHGRASPAQQWLSR